MASRTHALLSNVLLLFASAIWGFAFVAQRMGMEHIGPFLFNGLRFALGALVLVPVIIWRSARRTPGDSPRQMGRESLLLGGLLFAGANFQQVGLVFTTAGKAGFITGLYVVIVPILSLVWGQRPSRGTLLGGALAATGLYLLSVTSKLTLAPGDALVLVGALFWALHVLLIGRLAQHHDPLRLAAVQFALCAFGSLTVALVTERIALAAIANAALPILYGGAFSAGIAYTLQIVAQRHAPAAHAAIILSLETVFAALGGWMILDERLGTRALAGCALMLAGMLSSQLLRRAPKLRVRK